MHERAVPPEKCLLLSRLLGAGACGGGRVTPAGAGHRQPARRSAHGTRARRGRGHRAGADGSGHGPRRPLGPAAGGRAGGRPFQSVPINTFSWLLGRVAFFLFQTVLISQATTANLIKWPERQPGGADSVSLPPGPTDPARGPPQPPPPAARLGSRPCAVLPSTGRSRERASGHVWLRGGNRDGPGSSVHPRSSPTL